MKPITIFKGTEMAGLIWSTDMGLVAKLYSGYEMSAEQIDAAFGKATVEPRNALLRGDVEFYREFQILSFQLEASE